MSTNYTNMFLLCTISLVCYPAMGMGSPSQSTELAPLTAAEQPVPDLAATQPGHCPKTRLMLAASEGYADVVRRLLAQPDIDVNAKTKQGATALMLAASQGHEDVVRLLLAQPATKVNPKHPEHTPKPWTWWVMYAMFGPFYAIYETMFENNTKDIQDLRVTALMLAAANGHLAIVEQLLKYPGYVNAQTWEGYTALDYAIHNNHPAISELLKKKGGKTGLKLAMGDSIRLALRWIAALSVLSMLSMLSVDPYKGDRPWIDYLLPYGLWSVLCPILGLLSVGIPRHIYWKLSLNRLSEVEYRALNT